jgi:phosphate transport system substrate-binding protein
MGSVVEAWEEHFQQHHPGVHFETNLMGTDTAMPGLYSGLADLALFGRESNTTENDGFLHTLQYRPLRLRLMNGSLDTEDKSYTPVLFVAGSNPLQRLTLAQADAAFGCGHSGTATPARTWGDLGLTGDWKNKPIHIYMFDTRSGTGLFFVSRLQGESKKMNWEIIREFSDTRRPDGSPYPAGQQAIDALKKDPYGLSVSGMKYAQSGVKALALAATPDSPYVVATKQSVIDGSYPLARTTYAFVTQAPGQSVSPLVKQFLQFIYSDEGQALVARQGGFLPLSPQDAVEQQSLLH